MPDARLFMISGRVQGVFFRASTRRAAEALGLSGYAINLDSGDVEVLACGDKVAIERLAEWLQSGPPGARVDGVECRPAEYENLPGFTVG